MGHDIEVFKIVKQKYVITIVPEISVNSISVTRGNNYKLLNQTFATTYGSIHLHLGYPPPACMQDPACNWGPASIRSFTVHHFLLSVFFSRILVTIVHVQP